MLDCDLLPTDGSILWLCPACHLAYVQQNFCSSLAADHNRQMPSSAGSGDVSRRTKLPTDPKAADHLKSTFEGRQRAIIDNALAYHEIREKTLRSSLLKVFYSV